MKVSATGMHTRWVQTCECCECYRGEGAGGRTQKFQESVTPPTHKAQHDNRYSATLRRNFFVCICTFTIELRSLVSRLRTSTVWSSQ